MTYIIEMIQYIADLFNRFTGDNALFLGLPAPIALSEAALVLLRE
jgi:hypothetical protein